MSKLLSFIAIFVASGNLSLAAGLAQAQPHTWLGEALLYATYEKMRPQLVAGMDKPFDLQTNVAKGSTTGNVYAVLPYSYKVIANGLTTPERLCDAVLLHINIKGCVSNAMQPTTPTIDFFVGKKEYQHPVDAIKVSYQFSVIHHDEKYTLVSMTAGAGPLSTKNIAINIESIPIDDHSSFLRFAYSADYGGLARFALNMYLATMGRNKVGFSTSGVNEQGDPVYIKGIKGIVERNTMRYFFALHSYFDTIDKPEKLRFDASLNRWFDFVEKYPRQLYEVPREEYIKAKHKERQDTFELQSTASES